MIRRLLRHRHRIAARCGFASTTLDDGSRAFGLRLLRLRLGVVIEPPPPPPPPPRFWEDPFYLANRD